MFSSITRHRCESVHAHRYIVAGEQDAGQQRPYTKWEMPPEVFWSGRKVFFRVRALLACALLCHPSCAEWPAPLHGTHKVRVYQTAGDIGGEQHAGDARARMGARAHEVEATDLA